jgi:hypothetical protein
MNANPHIEFDRLTAIIRERQRQATAARQQLEILLIFCAGKSDAAPKIRTLLFLIFTNQSIPQTSGLGSQFDLAFQVISAAVSRKCFSRSDLEAMLVKYQLITWFAVEEDLLTPC